MREILLVWSLERIQFEPSSPVHLGSLMDERLDSRSSEKPSFGTKSEGLQWRFIFLHWEKYLLGM